MRQAANKKVPNGSFLLMGLEPTPGERMSLICRCIMVDTTARFTLICCGFLKRDMRHKSLLQILAQINMITVNEDLCEGLFTGHLQQCRIQDPLSNQNLLLATILLPSRSSMVTGDLESPDSSGAR
jgi:hypothetical protein